MNRRASSVGFVNADNGGRNPRRKKTARERRDQQKRSDTRNMNRLLEGLYLVHNHRGNRLSQIGNALRNVIENPSNRNASGEYDGKAVANAERNGDIDQTHSGDIAWPSPPICVYHRKGFCRFGNGCAFSHTLEDEGPHAVQTEGRKDTEFFPWAGATWDGIPTEIPQVSPYSLPTAASIMPEPLPPSDTLGEKLDMLVNSVGESLRGLESTNNALLSAHSADMFGKFDHLTATMRESQDGIAGSVTSQVAEINNTISKLMSANGVAALDNVKAMRQYNENVEGMVRLVTSSIDNHVLQQKQFQAFAANSNVLLEQKIDSHHTVLLDKLDIVYERFTQLDGKLDKLYILEHMLDQSAAKLDNVVSGAQPDYGEKLEEKIDILSCKMDAINHQLHKSQAAQMGPSPISGSGQLRTADSTDVPVTATVTGPTSELLVRGGHGGDESVTKSELVEQRIDKADVHLLSDANKQLLAQMLKSNPSRRQEIFNIARKYVEEIKTSGQEPFPDLELRFDSFLLGLSYAK